MLRNYNIRFSHRLPLPLSFPFSLFLLSVRQNHTLTPQASLIYPQFLVSKEVLIPSSMEEMQQSIDYSSVIPIKKRRFPVIESASPSSTENPSTSEVNKGESQIVTAATDISDLSKSTSIVATNTSVENSDSKAKKPEPAISYDPTDDLRNKVDPSRLAEEYAKQEVFPNSTGACTTTVKQEIACGHTEGAENVEFPLEPKPVICHTSEQQLSENNCGKSEESDPLLLSLDLSKENLDMCDNNDMTMKNVGANRSNWDLNTSMEEWEGSTNNDSFSCMSDFSKIGNGNNVKSSLSDHDVKTTTGMAGFSLTKGEHILTKCRSNSYMASTRPSQQNEPDDSLGLSLGVPFREFDASGKHSFVSIQTDTTHVGPNLNNQNAIMNFASRRNVKLEPVTEVSKREFSTKSNSSDMGLSNSSSVKREPGENHIGHQKLVEHGSIKSELVHERNDKVFNLEDSIRPQNVGRIMQHQESTASSAMTVPLTPQNSCPSKSSTCTESNTSVEQHQFSFHSEEAVNHMNKLHAQITGMVSKPFSQDGDGNLTVENSEKLELTRNDGHSSESRGKIEIDANEEEKINLSTEAFEVDTLGSNSESYENRGVSTPKKLCNREDGEYEEGEVRTPLQNTVREGSIVDTKKTENDIRNLQPFVLSGDQSTNTSDYDGKSAISENHDEAHSDHIKESVIGGCESENEAQNVADYVPEIKVDERISIGVTIEKQFDLSIQQDVKMGLGEEATNDKPTTRLVDKATDTGNKQLCSAKHDSTLSMVEESNGNDAANNSNKAGNKSRIINLPRASVATSYRTRSFPNRAFTSSSGNERYSDFDGDKQPRGNRNEHYTDKFAKGRVRDPSFRNSKPSFMCGNGRGYGRFGPSHNYCNSDNDFASEAYSGPSSYCGNRNKHTSSDSDRGIYRRKVMNDDKFTRHLPEDTIDPSYNCSHNMYDEFDCQIIRDKRNFSTIQRNPRITSKSPARSRTHSPGPWSSRRRRSPDGIQELNQHRSSPVYRMRRMRSPDRSYHEEMVSRRRGGSPPFITRHSDDLRDVDSHVHPRSFNSHRRSPPGRIFPSERGGVLDTRETGDVSVEERRKFRERRGPLNSFRPSYNEVGDNFHFHPNDGPRPYRFCQDGDTEFAERSNMRERDFGERSSMREREFDERSNMREREFDGHMKNQPLVASRRIRGVEEPQDGSYRPKGRVWHDDGFSDGSGQKRKRF